MSGESTGLLGLSESRLRELGSVIREADSVELSLSVPDGAKRSTLLAIGADLLDADLRHVYFFDTPGLALNRRGIVARGRDRPGDSVVKLRPVTPEAVASELRERKHFRVEVDAMPGGYVCSASFKRRCAAHELEEVVAGRRPLRSLFSKQQRAFFAAHAPAGIELDGLSILGPVHVLKLKTSPPGLDRKLAVELWTYPDRSHILELSTRCKPEDTFQVAAEARAFLSERGLSLAAEPQTKTRITLEYFAARHTPVNTPFTAEAYP